MGVKMHGLARPEAPVGRGHHRRRQGRSTHPSDAPGVQPMSRMILTAAIAAFFICASDRGVAAGPPGGADKAPPAAGDASVFEYGDVFEIIAEDYAFFGIDPSEVFNS